MNLKLALIFVIINLLFSSCRTKIIEYPIFYHTKEKIDNVGVIVVDEYCFNESCNQYLINAISDFANKTNSDDIAFKISAFNDSIDLIISDAGINSLFNNNFKNIKFGVVMYNVNCNNELKRLFFTCCSNNLIFLKKTNRKIKFKPNFVRLSKREGILYYDEISTFQGYIKNDSLHVIKSMLNGRIIE